MSTGLLDRADNIVSTEKILVLIPVALIVSVIIGVFSLSEATRRASSFAYAEPSLRTAYTAPFVHLSVDHLAGNVTAFLLVAGTFFALSRHTRTPWLFLGALVASLSIFPVTLSLLNLAVPRSAVTYGFSGVNMALVGFLPIAIGRYIEASRGRAIDTTLPLAVFFLSTGGIAALAVPQSLLTVAVGTVGVTLGVLFAGFFVRHERRLSRPRRPWQATVTDPAVIVGVGTWILLLVTAFPQSVASGGSVTNVYVHFVGYALGFMTAYLAHEWKLFGNRFEKRSDSDRSASP